MFGVSEEEEEEQLIKSNVITVDKVLLMAV